MSPTEVRSIVEAALRDGVWFPWWSYMLAFALSMLGAYVGSYIKRKAEDRAAQENFDALRAQLRKTTEDTEEIKANLSGRNWLSQQQWSFREQRYSELLSHLTKLRISLQDRSDYFMEPGSEHDESRTEGENFKQLARRGYESYQAIRELIGPASVFLSANAIQALEELVREHWGVAEFSICAADYITSSLKLVDAAHAAVLTEARSELARTQTAT
jgi:hypothetical protein